MKQEEMIKNNNTENIISIENKHFLIKALCRVSTQIDQLIPEINDQIKKTSDSFVI